MKRQKLNSRRTAALLASTLVLSQAEPILALADVKVETAAETVTDENTVVITSVDDLVQMSKNCVSESYSKGKTFVLTQDISLDGSDFQPIAVFAGNFQGNGHVISGLNITISGSNLGLFRYIEADGAVRGLIVKGNVKPDGSKKQIGGIVGTNRGTIENCEFHGMVSGQEAIGGIAGTNEEGAVIRGCKSYSVTTGNNKTGGITGNNDGTVEQCENHGDINASDQGVEDSSSGELSINTDKIKETVQKEKVNDAGGIAGYSASRVNQCYALCNLKGDNKIGGITGEGYDISNCLAMVTISGNRTEKIGSIAGCINEDGTLENNYFVSDLWGGVDQINYIGKAQRCTYEELMQMETVPAGFTQVTVTFEQDDEVLATLQIPYDGTVTEEEVPDIEPDEDCYISWDRKFPLTHVTANVTVTAESKRFTKSLAWFSAANQLKPDFLVEGDFYDTSVLSAESVQADRSSDGDPAYAYIWNIDNMPEQKEEYVLHLRIPDGADSAVVRIQTENKWEKADTEEDGSYVTVSVPYGTAFAVYSVQDNSVPIWLILALAIAAVLAAVLIIKAIRRGKKRVEKRREKRKKKKQQQTDSQ